MNKARRPTLIFNNPLNHINFSLFHSTPVLDRRRRTHWDSGGGGNRDSYKKFNQYAKRSRKQHSKQEFLRSVGAFAEELFQSWQSGFDDKDSKERSWIRREFDGKSSKGRWTSTQGPYSTSRRGFDFCKDDDDSDVETIFHGSFGGSRFFYCSFVDDDFPGTRGSFRYSNNYRTSWKWRHVDEEEDYDTSSESDSSESDRLALGLCPSGPLKMEDVKKAYRICALKWHPDRHEGKFKAVAEEKFKACSAAYQSLCDKLSLA